MSVCGRADEESVSEEPGAPARDLYQEKSAGKVVRVLTVIAYLLSVSLAAILLSVYYVCVWKSPELPPVGEDHGHISAQRSEDVHPNYTHDLPPFSLTGGGNITMSESANTSTIAHNSSGSERDSDNGPSTEPTNISGYFEESSNSTNIDEPPLNSTYSIT